MCCDVYLFWLSVHAQQCAEECLTYEAEDRSTVDEIEEWLSEIKDDLGVPGSGVESLLEDIIPVKAGPTTPPVGGRGGGEKSRHSTTKKPRQAIKSRRPISKYHSRRVPDEFEDVLEAIRNKKTSDDDEDVALPAHHPLFQNEYVCLS